jgi:hypothetical protein
MEHDQVCDQASFAQYVSKLKAQLENSTSSEEWENIDLLNFLEAMEAWATAWTEPANTNPWRHAADVLTAAMIYE